jgi:hypothetical protein
MGRILRLFVLRQFDFEALLRRLERINFEKVYLPAERATARFLSALPVNRKDRLTVAAHAYAVRHFYF